MTTDIRIQTSWRGHWKRKKLKRRFGADGVLALEDLWAFCAEVRQDGSLDGMSNEDIAIACDFAGDADAFVAFLAGGDVRLLDGEPGSYCVHDWAEHQPYIKGGPRRRHQARVAALIKHHKLGHHSGASDDDCPLCYPPAESCDPQTNGSENPAQSKQTVSPVSGSVSVSGSGSGSGSGSDDSPKNLLGEKLDRPERHQTEVVSVFTHWQQRHPDDFPQLHHGLREWVAIRKRITQDGLTVDRIKRAIDGMHLDDWEHREKNLSLWLVVKDAASVQRFERIANAKPQSGLSQKTKATLGAVSAWLESGENKTNAVE